MMTDLQNMNWQMIIDIMLGVTVLMIFVKAMHDTIRRDTRIKRVKENISGQCRGAEDMPQGGELLFSTDETDGSIQQGKICLLGSELFVSRSQLAKDANILAGYFRAPIMCISLKSVVESSVNGNNVNLVMMGIPLTVIIVVDSDEDAEKIDKRIKPLIPSPV